MKKDTFKQVVIISLFWGSLWGITEATIGYLAHLVLVAPGLAGFIMFPIGFYFMTRAYKQGGKPGVLFSTAAVAASIKLVDLFLPGLGPIKTINPAVCILLEAVAVILVFKLLNVQPTGFRFKEALAAGAGWRLAFLFYSAMLFVFALSNEFIQMGLGHILRFMLLESVINAFIIAAYLKAGKTLKWKKSWTIPVKPVIAVTFLTVAVLVKVIIAFF